MIQWAGKAAKDGGQNRSTGFQPVVSVRRDEWSNPTDQFEHSDDSFFRVRMNAPHLDIDGVRPFVLSM